MQTTNITDSKKIINATEIYKLGSKLVAAREKEAKNLDGKREARTLLKSYGATFTSWKDINKGSLKGRKNTQSWRGSTTSDRKEKRL